jgi:tRNA A-37 threonylcarbamoyl transferase component Bud32
MAEAKRQTVNGFELIEEIGRGGMGVVYKARQVSLDRVVALKFLPRELARDERRLERFLREARAAGKLAHPNIVAAYDVGEAGGHHYIAMEYVDGASAHKQLKEGWPFTESEVIAIGLQMASALKAAHAHGILHRDVKPDNILLDSSGRARLADLGLARLDSEERPDAHLTQDGTALGTPHYMSPEAAKGEPLDTRSDLYSLGASLYTLASGQTPFEGPTTAAILIKVATESPRPLRALAPQLSPALVAVVEKLMQRDPARRFQTAEALIAALEKIRVGAEAPAPAVVQRPARVRPHRAAGSAAHSSPLPYVVLGGAAGLVVLVIALAASGPGAGPAPRPGAVEKRPPSPQGAAKPVTAPAPTASRSEAQRAFEALVARQGAELASRPQELAAQWDSFLKRFPDAPQAGQARQRAAECQAAAEKLETDWQQCEKQAGDALAGGDPRTAARLLVAFARDHSDSPQGQAARDKLESLRDAFVTRVKEQIQRSRAMAEGGDYEGARKLLNGLRDELPDRLAEAAGLREALAAVQESENAAREKEARQAEVDAKRLEELHQEAAALARSQERPCQFDKAAALYQGAAKTLGCEPMRQAAAAWAERYSRAAQLWDRTRQAVAAGARPEVSELGQYRLPGRVAGWDDKGLTYVSPQLPGGAAGQLVPWRQVTPVQALALAKAAQPAPTEQAAKLDLGLMAYALGAWAAAAELLEPGQFADTGLQLLASEPHARAVRTIQETQAAETLAAGRAAREKGDRAGALRAVQTLKAEPLSGTDLVKANAEEIAALETWAQEAAPAAKAEEPRAEPGPASPETVAELKKLGWENVEGNWTPDPKRKGVYAVKDGKLTLAARDVALTLSFQLGQGAKLSAMVRYRKDRIPDWARRMGGGVMDRLGPGYGLVCTTATAQVYGPYESRGWGGKKGGPFWGERFLIGAPYKTQDWPMNPAQHQAVIQVKGDAMELVLDGRAVQGRDLRQDGTVLLSIEGAAEITMPQVRKL